LRIAASDRPGRAVPNDVLIEMLRPAFPRVQRVSVEPLEGGARNSNFRLQIDCLSDPLVLRIFEHDPVLCQKELDLLRRVRDEVPVPEVIYANAIGLEEVPPFHLLSFVKGISFHTLRERHDPEAMVQAATSVGATLAAIHRITFPRGGWLTAGLVLSTPLMEGNHAMPRFVDQCLASDLLQNRMGQELCDRVHQLMWSAMAPLSICEKHTNLVHGDFGERNILVQPGPEGWHVSAVLDWEFAVAGTPLADFGNFLRYERAACPASEPAFSSAYRDAGGLLPANWNRIRKVVDVVALSERLTRRQLPETALIELVELLEATVEDRDAQFPWNRTVTLEA